MPSCVEYKGALNSYKLFAIFFLAMHILYVAPEIALPGAHGGGSTHRKQT